MRATDKFSAEYPKNENIFAYSHILAEKKPRQYLEVPQNGAIFAVQFERIAIRFINN